jgi:hypothetical protein
VSRNGRKPSRAVVIAVAAVAVMAVAVSGALAKKITIRSGNLVATFGGGISPKKLPKKERGGLTLKLEGKLETVDKSHIPPVKTISLDFDKAGRLFTKGLPSCRQGAIESTLTAQAKKVCGKALVGTGRVTADIQFPEQAPFGAGGPLLIFNASKGNKQALLLHVHANVPAPTTFVVPVKIKKKGGKFGTNAFIRVPSITNGSGSVTSFRARIGKKWTYKRKRVNLLSAYCKTGSLFVHGDFAFPGSKLSGTFTEGCTPKG